MASPTHSDASSQSRDCELELNYESSDFDVEGSSLDGGIRPYQFEPEFNGNSHIDSAEENDDALVDRLNTTEWCQCYRCHVMPSVEECRCCYEIMQVKAVCDEVPNTACITGHPGFKPVCLDKYVLLTAYHVYRPYHGTIPESSERYRYVAYRQLVRWCWGYLGKDVRVPLPSCAVHFIRETFPSLNGVYQGFNYVVD
ncbi:uncharacterized protein LOC102801802 [Saccoglossus kowalevskii]|uniref:Uncharacterized protein LOC102801802 n=1 Tax=Saccoglossus kowalevskii TaxID=10224 RepID=A0ABM0LUD6_SACKO|nr:PREDICTED: uncharacterized protein LOC102801802 [Saccoglossus kowalevskii]